MLLLVGLGNPGNEFIGTRHNIGRDFVSEIQKKEKFSTFRIEKKWNADISEGKLGKERLILLLPDTYMNKSGNAVGPVARFYKFKPKDVIVVHDDADIDLGRAKLTFGRHSAGHKGVEAIRRALGSLDFWRLRIGIQKKKRVDAMKLVLQKFSPAEDATLKKVKRRLAEGVRTIADKGMELAMNEINRN